MGPGKVYRNGGEAVRFHQLFPGIRGPLNYGLAALLGAFEVDHGKVNDVLPVDGGDAEEILAGFAKVGVDDAALAVQLQREGAQSFGKSWNELMDSIASKSNGLGKANQIGGKNDTTNEIPRAWLPMQRPT
jgi:hypothetical protein